MASSLLSRAAATAAIVAFSVLCPIPLHGSHVSAASFVQGFAPIVAPPSKLIGNAVAFSFHSDHEHDNSITGMLQTRRRIVHNVVIRSSLRRTVKLNEQNGSSETQQQHQQQQQQQQETVTQPLTPNQSAPKTMDNVYAHNPLNSAIISHHVAIKTRNIENAIQFYSLLGFRVESKFITAPARAAWLIHDSSTSTSSTNAPTNHGPQTRIELIEVPSHMLDEPPGMIRRAMDLFHRPELLGINHLALDVTNCIPRPDNDNGASGNGTACALYQLREWMEDLNSLSVEKFGKTLRVAMEPTKRIIGRDVYEMAFLYDADGALVELLNWSGRLEQEVGDGWTPWDGKGFVV